MRASVLLPLVLLACGNNDQQFTSLEPGLAVFPEALSFGELPIGETLPLVLSVQNGGRGELNITEVRAPAGFELAETSAVLEADGAWSLPVVFTPTAVQDYSGDLVLISNDPEDPQFVVPLLAMGIPVPVPDIDITPGLNLDFGDLAAGNSTSAFLQVQNVGTAALHLGVVTQVGSGAFELQTDPSNNTVGAGDDVPVILTYRPTSELGDSGELRFPSDDPDEPEVVVQLIGNGGGNATYPEADIDCPSTASPPEIVSLDGSGSSSPGGGPLTYSWSLVEAPRGSRAALSGTDQVTTELSTDLGGEYLVQLQVFDALGTASAPDRCFIDGVPEDDIHVELTWDSSNRDLDLHLAQAGTSLYDVPGDVSWCNRSPDWGAAGTTDDPRLDQDDDSTGPENINVLAPADGAYVVRVHYYTDEGSGSAVTATVRVWLYGDEVWAGDQILTHNQVWDVGQINWPDGTFATEPSTPYDAPRKTCP